MLINLALDSVLEDMNKYEIEEIWCLGDIVGYYTWPEEVFNLLKDYNVKMIKGNHDEAISNRIIPEYFNFNAASSVYWTINNLSNDTLQELYELPFFILWTNLDII